MQQSTQPTAVETWFAEAGMVVVEVDACPAPDCPRCRTALDKAA